MQVQGITKSSGPIEEGLGRVENHASYLAPALGKGLVGDDEVREPEPEPEIEPEPEPEPEPEA